MPLKILVLLMVLALPLVPTFWALCDIPKRRFKSDRNKLIWFFTVSTLPCVGGILYLLLVRRRTEPIQAA